MICYRFMLIVKVFDIPRRFRDVFVLQLGFLHRAFSTLQTIALVNLNSVVEAEEFATERLLENPEIRRLQP
jgi:hypothetical protein